MTHDVGMAQILLEREMYSEADAARLLRVPQSTLHYWLEGGTVRGKRYRLVVRPERRGERIVTWGEFIEAGLLPQYRQSTVSMRELRSFIELRDGLGVPYPLAHARPFVGAGWRLLWPRRRRRARRGLVARRRGQSPAGPHASVGRVLLAGRVVRRRGGSLAASRRPEFAGHR